VSLRNSGTLKNKGTSLRKFAPDSGLRKFRHDRSIVETCYQLSLGKVDAQNVKNTSELRQSTASLSQWSSSSVDSVAWVYRYYPSDVPRTVSYNPPRKIDDAETTAGKSRFFRFLGFRFLKSLKSGKVRNLGFWVFKFSQLFFRKLSLSSFFKLVWANQQCVVNAAAVFLTYSLHGFKT